jgi:hypothetical protein
LELAPKPSATESMAKPSFIKYSCFAASETSPRLWTPASYSEKAASTRGETASSTWMMDL